MKDGSRIREKWWRQDWLFLPFTDRAIKKILSLIASTGIEIEYGGGAELE